MSCGTRTLRSKAFLFVSAFIVAGTAVIFNGCSGDFRNQAAPDEAYVENGVAWAFGAVELGILPAQGSIMLESLTGDQRFDTAQTQFRVYGATTGPQAAAKHEVAYVDYDGGSSGKLLAFSHTLRFAARSGAQRTVDLYVVLLKAGRSFPYERQIHLGTAVFPAGSATAPVVLKTNLKISLVARGVLQGRWAVHFPDVKRIVGPWQGVCSSAAQSPWQASGAPRQVPGQNPFQNVTDCRRVPAQYDICSGSPLKDGCRPQTPVQKSVVDIRQTVTSQGLETVATDDHTYIQRDTAQPGKLVFVSTTIAATDDTNASLCTQKFTALARTVGDRVNPACRLTPAPAQATGGKLTCAVTVDLSAAKNYLEKVCNVHAVFAGEQGETQIVQVLKP